MLTNILALTVVLIIGLVWLSASTQVAPGRAGTIEQMSLDKALDANLRAGYYKFQWRW